MCWLSYPFGRVKERFKELCGDIRKMDKPKGICHEKGEAMAKKIGATQYVECSSLTGEGVHRTFELVTQLTLLNQLGKKWKF